MAYVDHTRSVEKALLAREQTRVEQAHPRSLNRTAKGAYRTLSETEMACFRAKCFDNLVHHTLDVETIVVRAFSRRTNQTRDSHDIFALAIQFGQSVHGSQLARAADRRGAGFRGPNFGRGGGEGSGFWQRCCQGLALRHLPVAAEDHVFGKTREMGPFAMRKSTFWKVILPPVLQKQFKLGLIDYEINSIFECTSKVSNWVLVTCCEFYYNLSQVDGCSALASPSSSRRTGDEA